MQPITKVAESPTIGKCRRARAYVGVCVCIPAILVSLRRSLPQ